MKFLATIAFALGAAAVALPDPEAHKTTSYTTVPYTTITYSDWRCGNPRPHETTCLNSIPLTTFTETLYSTIPVKRDALPTAAPQHRGAYIIAVVQSLFTNRMLQTLKATAPNIDAVTVLNTGASEIQHVFKGANLTAVLGAYLAGLKAVVAFSLASSAFAALVSLVISLMKLPDHDSKKMKKMATV